MFTDDTRIIDLTVGELRQLFADINKPPQIVSQPDEKIRGLKAIAETLGISKTTLKEWQKAGIIGAPIIQKVRGVVIANRRDLLQFKPKKKY